MLVTFELRNLILGTTRTIDVECDREAVIREHGKPLIREESMDDDDLPAARKCLIVKPDRIVAVVYAAAGREEEAAAELARPESGA